MKPLTKDELQELEGILPEDKDLINRIVDQAIADDPDELRSGLDTEAATFDDGWDAAVKYAF